MAKHRQLTSPPTPSPVGEGEPAGAVQGSGSPSLLAERGAEGEVHPLLSLINKLSGYRILVVGDVILDEYLTGRTDRLSREAPIPVL